MKYKFSSQESSENNRNIEYLENKETSPNLGNKNLNVSFEYFEETGLKRGKDYSQSFMQSEDKLKRLFQKSGKSRVNSLIIPNIKRSSNLSMNQNIKRELGIDKVNFFIKN